MSQLGVKHRIANFVGLHGSEQRALHGESQEQAVAHHLFGVSGKRALSQLQLNPWLNHASGLIEQHMCVCVCVQHAAIKHDDAHAARGCSLLAHLSGSRLESDACRISCGTGTNPYWRDTPFTMHCWR